MKGLALARSYYEAFGKEMLFSHFADKLPFMAVGLVGEGSECEGFDDALSQDHDFEPGFCIWLSRKDYDAFGFPLERAYAKLPKEYMGFRRQSLAPSGKRHGVLVREDFYRRFLGSEEPPSDPVSWLHIPSYALRAATSGEVFLDGDGEFSRIREILKEGYPLDVRKKLLAAHALAMTQSGLYNYPRLVKREESGAAQLAVFAFVRHAISTVYLLNNVYEPFYKWAFRGMRTLPRFDSLADTLTGLCELGNEIRVAAGKAEVIENICLLFCKAFVEDGFSEEESEELSAHAYAVQRGIKNPVLRHMHILDGISEI